MSGERSHTPSPGRARPSASSPAGGPASTDAAREVEELGGTALALPTDVADPDQVEAAAAAVEERFGHIDVWVNDAMATIFAPFTEITGRGVHARDAT